MIELSNICKTYKSKNKKAQNTEALKNISIKLPKKGLVFILGKSGSGKSTLLNVLGGLDKYDSGDLIINGKSTKNFNNKDFDAYRNTYIGFIFQDFNLLENYSVEKNVSLSLELQNKKVDKDTIENILKTVGLEGFEKRKINELSGGQRQRVAIARALVKSPDVILADEPTGNLDSVTGRQIFELLKELSKEKLIIVVSHDDENARKYGDRIIELKDGSIIGDTENEQEKFENSEKFKLVSAKLPFKYSLKMGLGNLIHKKIKLILTILLISFAITCLGVMISATSFDLAKEHVKSLEKNNEYEIFINSYDKIYDGEKQVKEMFVSALDNGSSPNQIEVSDEKIKEAEDKTGLNWYKQIVLTQNQESLNFKYINDITYSSIYYTQNSMIKFVELDENNSKLLQDKLLGNLAVNKDEIVIPSYIADNIIQSGIEIKKEDKNKETETYKPLSYNQIINDKKYIKINGLNTYVKVTGIIKHDMSKSEHLKTISYDEYYYSLDIDVEAEYSELLSNEKYSRVYVTKDFIQSLNLKDNNKLITSAKIIYNDKVSLFNQIAYISDKVQAYDGNNVRDFETLQNNDILIDLNVLDEITRKDFSKKYDKYLEKNYFATEKDITNFIKNYIKENQIIGKTIKTNIDEDKTVNSLENYKDYIIVGVIIGENAVSTIYYNKEKVDGIIPKNIYVETIFTEVKNEEELRALFEKYPSDKSDSILYSRYTDGLLNSLLFTSLLKLVGKYGTMFFLVFAVILLVNFISSSITYRKKEIGILRAIGCKSKDIFTMFIVESIALISISLIISNILIEIIVQKFNGYLSSFIGNEVSFLNFGIEQQVIMIAVICLVGLLANLIPIKKVTKMKPIDAILNK